MYVFQKSLEKFVFHFLEKILVAFVFVVTICLVIDCTLSFKTALELRDVLMKLEEAKAEFKRLQNWIEIVETFLLDETTQMIREKKEQLKSEVEQLREKQVLVKENLSDRKKRK